MQNVDYWFKASRLISKLELIKRPYYINALYSVFLSFHKLVLSFNKALYLLKQTLLDILQK